MLEGNPPVKRTVIVGHMRPYKGISGTLLPPWKTALEILLLNLWLSLKP